MRKTLVAAMVLAILAVLTGCARYRSVATIDGSGTVSGSVIIGYTQELIELGKQMNGPDTDPVGELKTVLDANVAAVTSGSATVRPYRADGFTGFETVFSKVAPNDFRTLLRHDSGDPGVVFVLDRRGESYVFSAEAEAPKEGQIKFPDEAFRDVDVSFSLTFPGPVTSSNGEVSGNTVTWHPKLPRPGRLEAVGAAAGPAKAPVANPTNPGEPTPAASTGGDGGTNPAIYIGGAAVLLAAAGAIGYGLRRSRAGR